MPIYFFLYFCFGIIRLALLGGGARLSAVLALPWISATE